MGGKTGSSSTQVEIPEELQNMVFPFIQDAINRYDKFATMGASKIMPPPGQTNVNVRNPWDMSSGNPGDGIAGDPGSVPPASTSPTDPDRYVPDSIRRRGGGGGDNSGRNIQRH